MLYEITIQPSFPLTRRFQLGFLLTFPLPQITMANINSTRNIGPHGDEGKRKAPNNEVFQCNLTSNISSPLFTGALAK